MANFKVPMNKLSPMEHPAFTFTLISTRSNAHAFTSRELAQEFAKDIKQHSVLAANDAGTSWVVKVGPWMYARDIVPRRKQTFSSSRPKFKPLSWSPEMLARIGHEKDSIIAADMGCTPQAVGIKRRALGIATQFKNDILWTTEMLDMLGKEYDSVVANKLGISIYAVWKHRLSKGIPAARQIKNGEIIKP